MKISFKEWLNFIRDFCILYEITHVSTLIVYDCIKMGDEDYHIFHLHPN